jgi:hypothetical protein
LAKPGLLTAGVRESKRQACGIVSRTGGEPEETTR